MLSVVRKAAQKEFRSADRRVEQKAAMSELHWAAYSVEKTAKNSVDSSVHRSAVTKVAQLAAHLVETLALHSAEKSVAPTVAHSAAWRVE